MGLHNVTIQRVPVGLSVVGGMHFSKLFTQLQPQYGFITLREPAKPTQRM